MKIQLRKNYNQVITPLLISKFNVSTDSYIEQDLDANASINYQNLNSVVIVSYGNLEITADSKVFSISNYLIIDTPVNSLQISNVNTSTVSFVMYSDILL